MRLLTNGISTAATTVAGLSSASQSSYGQANHVVDRVQVSGGSSAANSAGITFRYGRSSDGGATTIVLCASDSSVLNVVVEGLGLKCSWWEAVLPTTSANGVAVSVFGD